jgi:hypothetical protein
MAGVVDRKWITHGGPESIGPGQAYVRAEGLPFEVTHSTYDSVQEGDEVSLSFRLGDVLRSMTNVPVATRIEKIEK